jgi:hypothetical protein
VSNRAVEFQQDGTVQQYKAMEPNLEHVDVHRFTGSRTAKNPR